MIRLKNIKLHVSLLDVFVCLFFLWSLIAVRFFQLAEARDRTLQRVSRAAEYKELKGKDPPRGELLKKIEQV